MRKHILTLTIVLINCALIAQSDTEFWFAVPEVDKIAGDSPASLIISSLGEKTQVTISQPANPDFALINFSLNPGEIKEIDLTDRLEIIENKPAGLILSKGIHIKADGLIGAYFYSKNPEHQEIFTLRGKEALGKEFLIPSQTDFRNIHGKSSFDIVATEDSTLIKIVPSKDIVGHLGGEEFEILLDKGESYSCRADNSNGNRHLAGSSIISSKVVVVTITDNAITNELNNDSDLLGDQLLPVKAAGTEYIVMKGEGETERLFILATENGTELELDGQKLSIEPLQRGEQTKLDISSLSTYVKSNYPIIILQLSGFGGEVSGALVQPINCSGIRKVKYIRPSSENFFVYLLTRSGMQSGFRLNGASNIVPDFFEEVPGTNGGWVSTRIEVKASFVESHNEITNLKGPFHMGMLIVRDKSSAYAHFSAPFRSQLADTVAFCEGEEVEISVSPDFDQYLWNTGETSNKLRITESGRYTVQSFQDNCIIEDSVQVLSLGNEYGLGNDTTLCPGDTLQLKKELNFDRYEWNTGATESFISVDGTGIYILKAELDQCEIIDSIEVQILNIPPLSLGSDTFLCPGESILLNVEAENSNYYWQDGSGFSSFRVTEEGLYHIQRTTGNCIQKDTINVNLKSLELASAFDTFICEGDNISIGFDKIDIHYLWENASTTPLRTVEKPGVYTLIASNECGSETRVWNIQQQDCACNLMAPNVFSPNGDGINDEFIPELDCLLEKYEMRVFDRWGEQLYASQNPGRGWNGQNGSSKAEPGIYYYQITYKGSLDKRGTRKLQGNFLLLR